MLKWTWKLLSHINYILKHEIFVYHSQTLTFLLELKATALELYFAIGLNKIDLVYFLRILIIITDKFSSTNWLMAAKLLRCYIFLETCLILLEAFRTQNHYLLAIVSTFVKVQNSFLLYIIVAKLGIFIIFFIPMVFQKI